MIFAEDRAVSIVGICGNIGQWRAVALELGPEMRGDCCRDINKGHGRVAHARSDARTRHDQGHRNAFLIQVRFPPKSARADIVAVIGRIDYRGVLKETGLFQPRHDLPDVVIQPCAKPIVGGHGAQAFLGVVKPVFRIHIGVLLFHPRMSCIARRGMQFDLGQTVERIKIKIFLRYD